LEASGKHTPEDISPAHPKEVQIIQQTAGQGNWGSPRLLREPG